ncbi:UPF0223 family protein [Macrococcus sp. DPC7161]|uniref:UPF0223 family protein n=1 Tax=Macrococcus sp. DPC7161 TaxID=2507060 RepID=UPI00100A40A4|nr:UPF0223 family protein [Macrococcus sp. DPC7161]RXK18850.1 hypothetical protein ER639_00640 [Macrococcus sp. DPC7161]
MYSYPIDPSWTKEEIIDVVNFLAAVESAYESKVNTEDLNVLYRAFKKVAPMKSDENNIYKSFKQVSGFDGYPVIQRLKKAKENNEKFISMK